MIVAPYDEPAIAGDDVIIRRIDPDQHIVPDENRNCRRISSKAYSPSSGEYGGMSVDIEKLISAAQLDPKTFVTTDKFYGSVFFSAQALRDQALQIGFEPLLPHNPYHGEVWGTPQRPTRFSGSQRNAMLKMAQWYVEIPDVELS